MAKVIGHSKIGDATRGREGATALERVRSLGQTYTKTLPVPRTASVVDFFAGCGGMSYGFQNNRLSHDAFDVLAGIDINTTALATYELNVGAPGVAADIRDIAARPDSLHDLVPGLNTAKHKTVFVGCPPCQGFSAHRKKDHRDDPRNNLVLAFAQICVHHLPEIVVIENVPEMLSGRFEHYWTDARQLLKEAGYSLAEKVLDLSLYGVPQRRRRAVVIATLTVPVELPMPIMAEDLTRTVRDAIAHLEPIAAGETDRDDPWHRSPNHIPRILAKIRQIPADGGDRRSLPKEDQLVCHQDLDAGKTSGFTDVYGRLRWDTPAVTITAKSSTPSCGRFLHPEQHRNISVREAALLQGFPHNYVFAGGFVNQYRQIGEAVPPLFAQHLAMSVLDGIRPHPKRQQYPLHLTKQTLASSAGEKGLASVDLFSGAGGLSLGLRSAGLRPAMAVDNDADAIDTYVKNISSDAVCASITESYIPGMIDDAVGGQPFIIAGGPPCQGFSQQRRGSNEDVRNDLVVRFADLVAHLTHRPKAVILENVTYLDSPRGRSMMNEFTAKMSDLGYIVVRHDINSADFGVAQLRRRIILAALDHDLAGHYSPPGGTFRNRWLTLGESLAGLPIDPKHQLPNHVGAAENELNKRRIGYVDMARGRTAIPEDLQLNCHRGYDGHLDVFGRLDWFGQARTITGGFDSASRGEYGHPFRNRSITAREAARVQGFPDWFDFQGNKQAVRRQIGNAVPPPLGYAIGMALLDATKASLLDG